MDERELDALYDPSKFLVQLPVFAIGPRLQPLYGEDLIHSLIHGEIDLPGGGTSSAVFLFTDTDLAFRFVKQRFPDSVGQFSPIQFATADGVLRLLDGLVTMGIAHVSLDSGVTHERERVAASIAIGEFRAAIVRIK